MRTKYLFLIFLSFLISVSGYSQVSNGGSPIDVLKLKKATLQVYKMPKLDNNRLLESSIERYSNAEIIKPFRFAHSFEVNYTPENSGSYFENINGFNIWQIKIQSEGAYSINLILEPFRIPPGARLFVFNSDRSHIIGAFTEFNNKPFNSLAISPVSGDEIILQYEEPVNPEFKGELAIRKVNHDFAGILSDPNGRSPLGPSGECNIDVNCELAKDWDSIKNSVCRIIVEGIEICSGSLVNNTKKDKTPYVLTANHCFADYVNGEQNTVFLFNYESPFCGDINGDITNSISGSLKIAESDTLDFSLVELSLVPPPEYRPYFAGWNRSGDIPDSTASIHHPLGDIKKIAIDYDSPVISSFGTNQSYLNNGFWKAKRWDYGTTEIGSSGGPFFDQDHRIIGTLTGGAANCSNPVNDYFERFDNAWDHYSEPGKQLKIWLDPINSGEEKLDGMQGYKDELFCDAFTNLIETDNPVLTQMYDNSGGFVSYWGGTNSNGISEYVEKYFISGDEILEGISLGVARIIKNSFGSGSYVTVNVYNGNKFPETLIYSKNVSVDDFVQSAMNFIGFDEVVEPVDTFFIGFDISNINENITFALYFAERNEGGNPLYFKQNGNWFSYLEETGSKSATLAFELIACNVENDGTDSIPDNEKSLVKIYPNPAVSVLNLVSNVEFETENISVYDLIGREISVKVEQTGSFEFKISLPEIRAGVYIVSVKNDRISESHKFRYIPY
ncbi:MAG: T9SS type A sorting domain-containing protein [Prolixibacteraceae bacterium]|nr:T9SS type A sorting domain-containing protein [Prolixibacteraceae bacterium]